MASVIAAVIPNVATVVARPAAQFSLRFAEFLLRDTLLPQYCRCLLLIV